MDIIKFWLPIFLTLAVAIWNIFQQIRIESLKKENEKQLHVHRLQFEKEFNIYTELWSHLVDVRGAASLLKIKMSPTVPNETPEQTIARRIREAIVFSNTTVSFVEKNKPFYAQNVYDELRKAIKLIRSEIIDVTYGDKNEQEYWREGEKNINEIIALIDIVCEAIRVRIGNLETK